MHKESLTKNTERVLEAVGASGIVKDLYLAGGTALALHLGHRVSIDLDWFSEDFKYNVAFRSELEKIGKLSIDSESETTFNGAIDGVKISFFRYPYPLISPKVEYGGNIYLADIPDISAMKMEAVAGRGSYKDFIDLYFILQNHSLEEVLEFVKRKFVNIDYNETHLLKSLTYFEDVKGTSKPEMIKETSWDEVTTAIKREVESYIKRT